MSLSTALQFKFAFKKLIFKSTISATITQTLAIITQKIVTEFQPEKIILFGSYAWGTPHKDSDVDLLIVKESSQSPFEMMREVGRSIFGVGIPTDVLVYTPAQLQRRLDLQDPFFKKVVTQGTQLYAR